MLYAMLCYALLLTQRGPIVQRCHATLRYAVLCYSMLCYAMLCYSLLCYAMLCYAMLCYAIPRYAMLRGAVLGGRLVTQRRRRRRRFFVSPPLCRGSARLRRLLHLRCRPVTDRRYIALHVSGRSYAAQPGSGDGTRREPPSPPFAPLSFRRCTTCNDIVISNDIVSHERPRGSRGGWIVPHARRASAGPSKYARRRACRR